MAADEISFCEIFDPDATLPLQISVIIASLFWCDGSLRFGGRIAVAGAQQ
jgi:hypothetical protein